ncbi:Epiplakin [Amphibalanus amphitrite]|uniref:Epiplakin n=1 Tax=Amphibalanus amphitrite TaxID=1232801 RepID=A0A6A4VI05_AMPAM|nr:Epiplakin [Amphibalanus amphitrite]
MPMDEAIEQQLVDAETGDVYDTETRETVSFFRAVKEGLVKPEDEKPTKIPLSRVVDKGWYSPKRGTVSVPGYDKPMPLDETFRRGIVNLDTVLVIDKNSNEYIPAMQAEENGLIDLLDGVVKDIDHNRDMPMAQALNKGIIIPRRVPMSLEAVIRRKLYHPGTGRIIVPGTDEPVKLDEAIHRQLIDSESSQIKDTQKNESVTLERAITTRLVDITTGQVTDTRSGHSKPLDSAYREGMIWTKPMPVDLTDAVQMGLYEPDTGKIIDPASGEDVTLQQAVELKIINVESIIVVDVETKVIHTYDRAVRAGLVDTERGVIRQPDHDVPLDRAFDQGMLAERKPPLALQEFVEKELYERATGHLIIFRTKERVTIEEAIVRTEINTFAETMKHPDTNEVLNLLETIERGFLDPVSGAVTDPRSGEEINLAEAMEHQVLLPPPKRVPLREVFEKNMYDPRTGRVSEPDTHETFTVERAIKIRLIDVSCTIVRDDRKNRVLSFPRALREGIINGTTGVYCPDKTRRMPLNEAFKEGFISDVELPMSIKDAIQKGVYDEDTGLFFDPTTGDWLTLLEAVEERGILDEKSVLNFETHSDYSLQEAFEVGLVVDSRHSLSLQQAIKDGMYDDETGRFTDSVSGWKVSLHDIIKRFIINPGLPCYFDTEEERLLNLNETCRAGIIDRRRGTFRHPKTGYDISLSEALRKGFIIDFEKPMSLYNLVHMGFYDPQTGKIVQPRTWSEADPGGRRETPPARS